MEEGNVSGSLLLLFSCSKGKHFVNYLPNPNGIKWLLYFCLTMLLYLFYFFLAFMLYQLVFRFILPVYRTTKQVRRSFRDMQNRMNGDGAGQEPAKPKGKTVGDYIDFEEVKEK